MQFRAAIALALLLGIGAPRAHAICNVIPGTVNSFRGALGAVDRPFAMPGDFVTLTLRPDVCDRASVGIPDHDGDGSTTAADVVVTLLFEPPNGGARNAVVLATDCADLGPSSQRIQACNAQLGGGQATCVAVPPLDLVVSPGSTDTRLRFRFPDTDARVGAPDDDRTLAGPATLAVTATDAPLPCPLAAARCADTSGLVACVDELYAIDGTCGTDASEIHPGFGSFTALPPPNDYQAVCDTDQSGSPCRGTATEVRLTTDAAGNALMPFDYRGVLVRLEDVPIPRLVRGSTRLDAFAGGALDPIRVPDASFLASFSPEGHRVPPIFTPLRDPSASDQLTLFGSIDAPLGVIRISRKGPGTLICSTGDNAGNTCTSDAECPGGECALFELRDRYAEQVGPIVVPDTDYTLAAETPVPLDGLAQTQEIFAFTVSEALANRDLNGDGDQTDFVLTLRDRTTGEIRPIGRDGSPGRAVVRIHEPPYAHPAVQASGDLVAFLESEPGQGYSDTNGNGNVFDPILRIFRLGTNAATEVTPTAPVTAEASPDVDRQSGAFGAGGFVFRTPEAREARYATERVSLTIGDRQVPGTSWGSELSADGRQVSFTTDASLDLGDFNFRWDIYVRDLATGAIERISVDPEGTLAGGGVDYGASNAISADGGFVVFASFSDYIEGIPSAEFHLYARDQLAGTTERIDHTTAEWRGCCSNEPEISADGRFVAYESSGPEDAGDTDDRADIFVLDRATGSRTRVSVDSLGVRLEGESVSPSISADGRFVSFQDSPGQSTVYIHDRQTGLTERVGPGNGSVVSPDGRFVAFTSEDGTLVSGDTNGSEDAFVYDRSSGLVTRESLDSSDRQGSGLATDLSDGGRFLSFVSFASLVPTDRNGRYDVYLRDRTTGETALVSADPTGAAGAPGSLGIDGGSYWGRTSADGRVIAFSSDAPNLVPRDTNRLFDVFVRRPNRASESDDRSGDGADDDTVLRVAATTDGSITDLCPADATAVAGARVAFLRPEGAGPSDAAACVQPDADLNGDGDTADRVLHVWDGAALANLSLASTRVALSDSRLAFLVSEADQATTDLDGDGDTADQVLFVAPATAATAWIDTTLAADDLAVAGDEIVIASSERQEDSDLNGDGDVGDRVLRIVAGADGALRPLLDGGGAATAPLAVIDFVLGDEIVAFRVPEADQGENLNAAGGDDDLDDSILAVVDLATGRLFSTGQAAVPCQLEACDPRRPYRVSGRAVSFLSLECQQGGPVTVGCPAGGTDLNGDGDAGDLVLQVFQLPDVARLEAARAPRVVAAVAAGYCSDTGSVCATDGECSSQARCIVPPGLCVADEGTACAKNEDCAPGLFCRVGTCHEAQGPCKSTADCVGGARCEDSEQEVQRVIAPLAEGDGASGDLVLASSGTCREPLGTPCDPQPDENAPTGCGPVEACITNASDSSTGRCQREHGACVTDADCPIGTCAKDVLITASAADSDADDLADPIDNCPSVANSDQADLDQDGIGDACDRRTCGNGIAEGNPNAPGDEECDDGNRESLDGCSAECRIEAKACANERDDDGDGLVDLDDPGCPFDFATYENPPCDDGIDNDGDGLVDFDDAWCSPSWPYWEAPPCGLGAELPFALALLGWASRRAGRAR